MSLIRGLLLHALAKLLYLGFAWSCTILPTLQIWPVGLRWKHGRNKAIFKNSLFIAHYTSPRIVLLRGNFEPYFQHIFWLFEPREVLSSKSCQSTSQKAIADKHTRTIFPKNLRAGRPVGFVYFLVEQVSEFNSTDLKLTTSFFFDEPHEAWTGLATVGPRIHWQFNVETEMRWSESGNLRKQFPETEVSPENWPWLAGATSSETWDKLQAMDPQDPTSNCCDRCDRCDRKLLLCAQVLVFLWISP